MFDKSTGALGMIRNPVYLPGASMAAGEAAAPPPNAAAYQYDALPGSPDALDGDYDLEPTPATSPRNAWDDSPPPAPAKASALTSSNAVAASPARQKLLLLALVAGVLVVAGVVAGVVVASSSSSSPSPSPTSSPTPTSASASTYPFTLTCGVEGSSTAACDPSASPAPALDACCPGFICNNTVCTQPAAITYPIPAPPGSSTLLPPAQAADEIVLLVADAGTPTERTLARRVGNHPWEPVGPLGLDLTCIRGHCSANLARSSSPGQSPRNYTLQQLDTSNAPATPAAAAARLLAQATFGATRDSIAEVQAMPSTAAWVRRQMDLPASLHREHYRARLSPQQRVADALGVLRGACEAGSRWNEYLFQWPDEGSPLVVTASTEPGYLALKIHGSIVSEMVNDTAAFPLTPGEYTICSVDQYRGLGGDVEVAAGAGASCDTTIKFDNPAVYLTPTTAASVALDFSATTLVRHVLNRDVYFLAADTPAACVGVAAHLNERTIMSNGSATVFYRHDPRVKLLTNTLESPASVPLSAAGQVCPAVPKTFLNEQACQRKQSCAEPLFGSAPVELSEHTLRQWFLLSKKYVYFVTGLRLEDPYNISPCESGRSRWRRANGTCPTPTQSLDNATLTTIRSALSSSSDTNRYVRDIMLTGDQCTDSGGNTIGAQIQVGTECFEHVHPDLYDVRDFSYWVLIHDGNNDAMDNNRPNPIAKWADQGLAYIHFPGNHPLSRWSSRNKYMPVTGRLGDTVDFVSLNTELQTLAMADLVGATVDAGANIVDSCGSPGEVANTPHLGHYYNAFNPDTPSGNFRNQLDYPMRRYAGKAVVWATVAAQAADQLRQRAAWLLSQIFIISSEDLGRSDDMELWSNFYDIFVRHAFGNYRDIMREVAYHPLMGDYLTFRQNKAYAASGKNYPDENFAREIMQLFSIGLWKLGDDGVPLSAGDGNLQATYSNDDIVAFARVWTGFDRQSNRGNVETPDGEHRSDNHYDPMQIKPEWRDRLPKTKLDDGYLGDDFALCHELPAQDFLRKGATYVFTGEASAEGPRLDAVGRQPPTQVLQAEEAQSMSSRIYTVLNGQAIRCRDSSGNMVEWTLERDEAETVNLTAYYYLNSWNANRPLLLEVNDVVVHPAWPFTTERWPRSDRLMANDPVEINLLAGTNTIRLTTIGERCADIDFLALDGDGTMRPRFAPAPASSSLHQALCAPDNSGACTLPSKVVLDADLPCDGIECSAGRVLTVAIDDTERQTRFYYRYQPRPCVRLALFDEGREVVQHANERRQCSPPAAPHSVMCCSLSAPTETLPVNFTAGDCLFANEATTYAEAVRRCQGRGGVVCSDVSGFVNDNSACAEDTFVWTNASCTPSIQVYRDGYIGLIDPAAKDTSDLWQVMKSSHNTFLVRWNNNTAIPSPTAAGGCGPSCTVSVDLGGNTCVCQVEVVETVPYTSTSDIPLIEEVERMLFIGAAEFTLGDTHALWWWPELAMVNGTAPSKPRIWTVGGAAVLDRDTVFELPPRRAGGPRRFLLNRLSTVHIPGQPQASFRNPPAFMPLLGEHVYDSTSPKEAYLSPDLLRAEAALEVEVLLDHLFEHDNTGPFVGLRLIQHMVTSNPSPSYVKRVTAAFRSGRYNSSEGVLFGSGKYGDLEATVAAVLLDVEARTPGLDADPTFGHGFEPLLKLMAILRGLELKSALTTEVMVEGLEGSLAMEPFHSPTVFGFYLPEFSAAGRIEEAGLVSPELELLQTPLLINFLNGVADLINRGLRSCNNGFGNWCFGSDYDVGYEGRLTWAPSAEAAANGSAAIVDELALILTQDRLHPASRAIIAQAHARMEASQGADEALRLAEKLVLASPEFHVSSANTVNTKPQAASANVTSAGRPFKAIVVFFMAGGCDSFNVLVPHSNCKDSKDYYDEYVQVRTNGALPKEQLLPVEVPTDSQPCDTFGVHPSLGIYKQLMEDGDGAFVANIGAMVEPLTKQEYFDKTKKLPLSLFAHNAQQEALATVHAQDSDAKGVLARIVTALQQQDPPYKSDLYSMRGNQRLLQGTTSPYDIVGSGGIQTFREHDDLIDDISAITSNSSESVFADTYSKVLRASLARTEALAESLDSTSTDTKFADDRLSQQFEKVARLIKLRDEFDTERGVFVVSQGGYDTHNTWDLGPNLGEVNAALTAFVQEMKTQGVWDDVVVFTVSDFARTLTSNGRGSDHAWGGNHFMAGGAINGGQMFGHFPDSLASDGELYIGRGRLIPTTPWEAVWEGFAQWFGVEEEQMAEVLPNLANFPPEQRFNMSKLFNATAAGGSGGSVGANHNVDWKVPAAPSTLNVAVGDTVTFTWSGYHDVQRTASASCDFGTGAEVLAGASSGGMHIWQAPSAGTFHFACSIGSHCADGMALEVVVS